MRDLHWCISYYAIFDVFKNLIDIFPFFLDFVVVVDNGQNKRLLALCCIIRKGNIADILYTPSNN